MDNLKPIQDDSIESSNKGIKHNQRESTSTERDRENLQDAEILDLLQLDDISPEDELEYTCGKHPLQLKKSLHIKIKTKERDVNVTSCDPFNNEEDYNSIEVQKEINLNKSNKMAFSEAINRVSRISNSSSSKEIDKENTNKSSVDNKKDITISSWIPENCTNSILLMSSEKADELMKALIFSEKNSEIYTSDIDIQIGEQPNVCSICGFESDNVVERIEHLKSQRHLYGFKFSSFQHCQICGYFCNKVQDRIEHVFGSRHIGAQEVKNAILCGVLENYTTNTFYCTVCSWFVTDLEPLTEHILSIRHKKAVFICRYKRPYNYKGKGIGILTTNGRGEVKCTLCKFVIKSWSEIDEIYDHLKINHDILDKKILPDKIDEKHSLSTMVKEKTGKKIKYTFDKKEGRKNMNTQIDNIENDNASKIPSSLFNSHKHIENVYRIKNTDKIFEKDFKTNKNASEIPSSPLNSHYEHIENEYRIQTTEDIFEKDLKTIVNEKAIKRPSSPLSNHYEHSGNEYRIKTIEEIFEKDFKTVQINIPNHPENDISNNINHQISDGSKSLKRRSGSRSPINDSWMSIAKIPNGRDQIKQHHSKSPSKQPLSNKLNQIIIANSDTNSIDVDSDDELEELNIITSIVKLSSLCDLLGNLGYFFEITLNKALERKEFIEDVLNILREPANIILMEVLLKKLETFDKSYLSGRIRKEFIKGIMYLTYLIDASNSSQLKNIPRDFSLMLDSSSLTSIRPSTEKMASNCPSVSSKNLELCHGLSVKEIAEATVGKNLKFTIDFIKNCLQDLKRTSTLDVISDIALAVSTKHFKMLSDL